MWERGLKQRLAVVAVAIRQVAPHVGAWIETRIVFEHRVYIASLPMWERGLKLVVTTFAMADVRSLPMWERGLKLRLSYAIYDIKWSLPMWERGLKRHIIQYIADPLRRSPCGSVD